MMRAVSYRKIQSNAIIANVEIPLVFSQGKIIKQIAIKLFITIHIHMIDDVLSN